MKFRSIKAGPIPDEAKIAQLREALSQNPQDAEAWLELGAAYSQSEFETAIRAYSRAIALAPFNGEYYFHRGRKYLSTDRYEEALADFHTSLWLEQSDAQPWHYLGVALYYLKMYEEAARYFRDALAMNKKTGDPCIWPEIDWVWMSLQRAGDAAGARAALDLVADDEWSSADDMAYKKRVRLYKGLISLENYLDDLNREDILDEITELYGAVNYCLFIAHDPQRAKELTDRIVDTAEYHNAFAWKCAAFDRRDGIA